MEKRLRLKFAAAFGTEMKKIFPEFIPVKIKSMYVWPGELIWRKNTSDCSYFIVLTPESKGQRDEMTIELGWSRLMRFPELIQRPSLVSVDRISNADKNDEGTVRIGSLCEGAFDWTPIENETISDVVAFFMLKLQQNGMPFLTRCGKFPAPCQQTIKENPSGA